MGGLLMRLAAIEGVSLLQRLIAWQMQAAMGALYAVDRFGPGPGDLLLSSLADQVADDQVEAPQGQAEQEISKSHEKILSGPAF
jgi:hypothetical protein